MIIKRGAAANAVFFKEVVMKKNFLIIAIFTMCSLCFARVISQVDVNEFTNEFVYNFAEIEREGADSIEYDFATVGGFFASLMYEFNSESVEDRIHYLAGASFGLAGWGFPACLDFGVCCGLKDFEKLRIEMLGTIRVGSSLGLFGGADFYTKQSVDVVLMNKNRRGLYGGFGFTNDITTEWLYSDEYEDVVFSVLDTAGMHFVLGIRF